MMNAMATQEACCGGATPTSRSFPDPSLYELAEMEYPALL